MKINIRILFVLGFVILLLPQIGLSHVVEEYAQYVIGLALCVVTFLVHKQLLSLSRKNFSVESRHDTYKENHPIQ